MAGPVGVVPPPPGVTPDFDYSNPWLYQTNKIIIIVGLIVCTIFLVLRIYTKAYLVRNFGWDDVFIILAWICVVGTQFCSIYGYTHGGIGIHMWNVTPEMFSTYLKVLSAAAIIYVAALALAKISLIILYYRVLHQQGWYHWVLYVLTVILAGSAIAIILALIFGCQPIKKAWDISITEGKCIDQHALFIATAVMNIFTDLVLILLPIPTVMTLHMPSIQKIGLLFMFTVGCATFITSIIRLSTLFPFLKSPDPTYKVGGAQLWVNIEANFIIICGCLPYLRNLLRHYAPKWIGEGSRSSRRYQSSSMGSTPRIKRKLGLTRLQDDLELTAYQGPTTEVEIEGGRIVKEVEWEVTAEQSSHAPESAGGRRAESILSI